MTVEDLIRSLAQRDPSRSEATLQADVRHLLLTGGFDLGESQVVLESQAGGRRRIDVEVGATVIEVKRDLRVGNVRAEAIEQLQGYVHARQEKFGKRYVGVLTDGAEWRCYHLDGGGLVEVSALHVDKERPDEVLVWLEGVLATARGIMPTPDEIRQRLGAGSSSHALDRATLASLYAAHQKNPAVRIKRRLWAKLLETALGTQFDDSDELFIEHTLLVNSAEIVAHAVLGLSPDGVAPASLLSGAKFDESGIHGVVEADFFDWAINVPGGERFVRTLAHRLARFDWSKVEHDVLKVLYESVISAETRKKLGEYYTPDWLAQRVVETVVTDPLRQRVLDPSCGSGTFLFHAVKRYLKAAEAKGVPLKDMLDGVTRSVFGMDLHPVAVTLARVTYVLAIGRERLVNEQRGVINVPVYLGDTMQWERPDPSLFTGKELKIQVNDQKELFASEFVFPNALLKDAKRFDSLVKDLSRRASNRKPGSPVPSLSPVFSLHAIPERYHSQLTSTFKTMCSLHDQNRDHIWGYYIRNLARPEWLALTENRADVLVGNPPWLSYRFMPAAMQKDFKEMCEVRGLWHGAKLATQQDLSALFIARSMQLYLKKGGAFGFVVPDAALDRGQFKGFRSGDFKDPSEVVRVAFDTPWDLKRLRPHFFPRGAAVVFGRRSEKASAMPDAEIWSGRLPGVNATWMEVEKVITRGDKKPKVRAGKASPYRSRFRQGATIVPRVLFLAEKKEAGPFGMPKGKVAIRSVRSANEKAPWKNLPDLEGVIETEFLRPVYLGETVLPYRVLSAARGVIPRDQEGLMDPTGERIQLYPGVHDWWQRANECWEQNRSSDRLTLLGRLDYHGGLSNQFPVPERRVVYSKSGMHLAAAQVVDHRAVIDHSLYWAAVDSAEEAHYLCAVLNAATTTRAVRPLMSYGKDERHIDKYVWELSIPEFRADDMTHTRLAALGKATEIAVAALSLDVNHHFAASRRKVREFLEHDQLGKKIEALVAQLLGA